LLYKELLEASARQQRTDAARKLKAHRDAWAAKSAPPRADALAAASLSGDAAPPAEAPRAPPPDAGAGDGNRG
jgi:hypothetical protein